jgi:shikimate 5-dehydrogenase
VDPSLESDTWPARVLVLGAGGVAGALALRLLGL